ncbi:MAG: hypothetical protein IT379_13090 [Deltaproteobacteria bacterium]|nr:hypothetical protein [Deltaproteobacteria bacterium]
MALTLATIGWLGCSGSDGIARGDSGPPPEDVEQPDASLPATPVAPAALPVLGPCPAGWLERPAAGSTGVTTCVPWEADDVPSCVALEARFPGDPGCAAVGGPCPADDWSEALPADATILFVRSDALSGRRGTRESPMRLSDAIARARDGTIVALAKGTYEGPVIPVAAGVTLWGACASETHLTQSTPEPPYPVVLAQGDGAVVRDVHVSGAAPGIAVIDGVEAHVQNVVIERATMGGILVVDGAHLTGHDVVVRDTATTARGDGVGIFVRSSRVELERVVIERSSDFGLNVIGDGADVSLTDAAVTATRRRDDGINGFGVLVFDRARVALARAIVEGSEGIAEVSVDRCGDSDVRPCPTEQPGAHVSLTDSVVRGSEVEDPGLLGYGLQIRDGDVAGTRLFVSGARTAGFAVGPGGAATLLDSVVSSTRAQAATGNLGRGINAQQGASVELTRVLLAESRDAAIVGNEPPTRISLTDVTISASLGRDCDGAHGRAVQLQDGAELVGERVAIDSVREYAVLTFAARATLTDLRIAETASSECRASDVCFAPFAPSTPAPSCRPDIGGVALGAFESGGIDVTSFALVDNALSAGFLTTGGTIDLHGGLVQGHPVGFAVFTEGFDRERLRDDVRYLDNETDIQARELDVPERLDAL